MISRNAQPPAASSRTSWRPKRLSHQAARGAAFAEGYAPDMGLEPAAAPRVELRETADDADADEDSVSGNGSEATDSSEGDDSWYDPLLYAVDQVMGSVPAIGISVLSSLLGIAQG